MGKSARKITKSERIDALEELLIDCEHEVRSEALAAAIELFAQGKHGAPTSETVVGYAKEFEAYLVPKDTATQSIDLDVEHLGH